jgi:uncharacterized repeat protein (TIGR01451 family)
VRSRLSSEPRDRTRAHRDHAKRRAAERVVVAGQIVTYSINVASTGASPAVNATFTDVIPAGLTVLAGTVRESAARRKNRPYRGTRWTPSFRRGNPLSSVARASARPFPARVRETAGICAAIDAAGPVRAHGDRVCWRIKGSALRLRAFYAH